jgi:hypothetical protein
MFPHKMELNMKTYTALKRKEYTLSQHTPHVTEWLSNESFSHIEDGGLVSRSENGTVDVVRTMQNINETIGRDHKVNIAFTFTNPLIISEVLFRMFMEQFQQTAMVAIIKHLKLHPEHHHAFGQIQQPFHIETAIEKTRVHERDLTFDVDFMKRPVAGAADFTIDFFVNAMLPINQADLMSMANTFKECVMAAMPLFDIKIDNNTTVNTTAPLVREQLHFMAKMR